MRDILTALEANEETGKLEEEEVAIIEEIVEVLERKTRYQLLESYQIRSYYRKLLRSIKFCVNLKQKVMNYFLQELLLLQIGWE